jgi:hypothetical protein
MADRNETIQALARERVKLSGGALSLEDAVTVATSQVEADEAAAATEKKKGKGDKPDKS